MQETVNLQNLNEFEKSNITQKQKQYLSEFNLVNKKIPMRFCEYKISNVAHKMLNTETIAVSNRGIMFNSHQLFSPDSLLRIWIEIPDYWARKSRFVSYKHTDAPIHFQILSRVVSCDEILKKGNKFQILSENLNLDPIDENVLNEYLESMEATK